MKAPVIIAAVALATAAARADLLTHAIARYGDSSLTIDEHFGADAAHAQLQYTSPGVFRGIADATAAYGSVTGTATVLAGNASYTTNAAHAEGSFSDLLTVSGPSGLGFVVYTYTVTGATSGALSQGALFLRHGSDPDEELDDEITGDAVFSSLPHGIVFGQAFSHSVVLLTDCGIGQGQTGEFVCELTATMTGLTVFDAAMNPIADYSIASASGTQYPLPEPGTALVLATALHARRRRRPCSQANCC